MTEHPSHRASSLLLGVALLGAACSSGGQGARRSPEAPVSATIVPTSIESSSPGPVTGAFIRTCESSVYGDLGKGWRKSNYAVVVGPFALLYPRGYADDPVSSFERHGTGYRSQKVLAVVEQGTVVTVAIASSAADVASLLYDPERFNQTNGYEVSDGELAVTFEACAKGQAPIGPPNGATQFNGGFVVAGSRCVPLKVWVGNNAVPKRLEISFGAGDCTG